MCPGRTDLAKLPRDVWFQVFEQLDVETVAQVALVCRDWHSIFEENILWKRLSGRNGFVSTTPVKYKDWKLHFRNSYETSKVWFRGQTEAIGVEGHSHAITSIQFDEDKIVTGSWDKTLRVWQNKTLLSCSEVLEVPECVNVLSGHGM